MSGEGKESLTVIANLYGGTGGVGGLGGITGGTAGTGEGATMNINRVQNLTNNIVNQGQGLEEVLRKWLCIPPDITDRHHELQSLRYKATGDWLLRDDQFIRWKATSSSLWIKGISGTGKSVLSSTVIKEIVLTRPEQSTVAYFFFDFRNERQHVDIMLRFIIWQLSERSPLPYSTLEQLYKRLGNGAIQPHHEDLQEVFKNLVSEFNQTYIIIDGLDECNKTDWKLLVQFIHSLLHPIKKGLHLLFTSQPLGEFTEAFKDVSCIELGSAVSTGDIRSFIGSKVPKIGNWASEDSYAKNVTEQIVQKSNGMFRFAACLLIELGHCRWEEDWEETLTVLPADLFGIYSRFFTRAKDAPNLPTVFIQAIFRWLLFSARQVTLDELADAIAFRLDAPAFDFSDPAKSIYYPKRRQGNSEIFKLLEGLIVIKNKDQKNSSDDWDDSSINDRDELSITLAHSSVKDYILSTQFHQQFSSIIGLATEISHKFIAQTCVRYLLLFAEPQHLMTKDTLPDYPIALYTAEYWYHHLQLCDEQDQETLLPSTMHLLEDGSSQHAALYQLRPLYYYEARAWDEPISPAVCICSEMGYIEGVRSMLIEHNASVDLINKDGQTALHLASSNGDLNIARLLLEHNASVNLVDKYGWTALHLALSNSHLDIARLLIECNVSVNLVKEDGQTALHLASRNGHLDIARLLIECNGSVDLVDKDGSTALHLALSDGHLDIARLLVESNASVDLVYKADQTVLHQALHNGHLDIARLLIEHNAPADLVDEDGRTVLHLASHNGHLDIGRLLIEHTASVNLVDKDGLTALHLALGNGHLDIARLLIEHNASVNLVDKDGWTALHVVSGNGHLDIARLLIEHNASVNLFDKDGWTALHLTSSNGHLDIARLLIESNASVDLVNKYGWTALHLASRNGHLDIARLLIECNASVDLVDKYGQTALHLASRNGHLDIARLLIECNTSVDLVVKDGSTALHLALSYGHLDIARLLIESNASIDLVYKADQTVLHLALHNGHLDIARLLIEHNASVNLVNKDGLTALHLALGNGHLDIARLLIQHNASADSVDKDGRTALHLALTNGHLDIARLLIEHNASVDLVDKYGWTALHLALSNGDLDIARLLIECNASADLVNEDGQTALHLASSNSHLDIARLLNEHTISTVPGGTVIPFYPPPDNTTGLAL